MEGKIEAHYENRIYYFNIVDQKPTSISISMYSTDYTFVQVGERWVNHQSNKLEMSAYVITAIMVAVGIV